VPVAPCDILAMLGDAAISLPSEMHTLMSRLTALEAVPEGGSAQVQRTPCAACSARDAECSTCVPGAAVCSYA
jgi:hypothetical protein